MWAHYTNKCTGVAFEFEENELPFTQKEFQDVHYSGNRKRSVISLEHACKLIPNPEKIIEDFRHHMCTKHEEWKYEEEKRIIYSPEPDEAGMPYIKLKPPMLLSIYFGMNIMNIKKRKYRKQIIALIKNKFPKTDIYTAEKNDFFMRFDFTKLNK